MSFLFTVFFLVNFSTFAIHLVGGELEFVHLTEDSYQIALTTYYDAVTGSSDLIEEFATVAIFSKQTNQRVLNISLPLNGNNLIAYIDPLCTISQLAIRRIYYERVVVMDRNLFTEPEGYYMVWDKCCRNNTISNIINPTAAGLTMYLEFPPLLKNGEPFINSEPVLYPRVNDYICINQPFFLDFSAIDEDGDELRYHLSVPISGNDSQYQPEPAPYNLVEFSPGISVNNMIPGSVPLRIDQSGILSVTASQIGLFVFAVTIDEYRDGVKIGEVRRDYQLFVIDCPTATSPKAAFKADAEPTRYVEGTTIILDANESKCGKLFVTDADANTVIQARLNPINFTDISDFSLQNGGRITDVNSELSLNVCFPDCPLNPNDPTIPYIMDLIISDNSCTSPLLDTVRVNVLIRNSLNTPPTFITDAVFDSVANCYVKEVRVGEQLLINTTADDINGDSLNIMMTDLPLGAIFIGNTQGNSVLNGQIIWIPDCTILAPNETEKIVDISFTTTDIRKCDSIKTVETCLKIKVLADSTQGRASEISANLAFDATTNQYVYDSIFVGEIIDFTTLAIDLGGDSLIVEFLPQNFTNTGRTITYSPLQGIGSLNSNFTWQTSCEDLDNPLNPQTFIMNFDVKDDNICGNTDSTNQIQVRVVLLPRPNLQPTIRTSLIYDSTKMAYCDTLTLGEPYRFTLTSNDPNGDSIQIIGNGIGFNFEDYQMQFTEVTGRPILTTDFVWNTNCDQTNILIGTPINLKFRVIDFNECENSLGEEIDVKLIILPPDPNNTAPEIRPEITTFDTREQVYVDTVFVGDAISFDVLGIDSQNDSVFLCAQGIGFELSDFDMTFPQVSAFVPIRSTFNWQTLCEYLGDDPISNPKREFLIDFISKDFNECQKSLVDTVRVKLILLYEKSPNSLPQLSTNLTFNAAQNLYIRSVRVDEFVRFDITGEDQDNSSLSLTGNGIGFDFADLNMNFTNKFGRPSLISTFDWQPSCSNLGFQNADTSYFAEFIVTDIANCDIIYADTIKVRFDLTVDPQNNPPTLELQNTDSVSTSNPNESIVRIKVGQELIIPSLANDVNGNRLSLSARGVGFILSDLGMQYENRQGFPILQSNFSWTPQCEVLGGEFSKEFKVIFTTLDTTRCGLRTSTPKTLTIIVEGASVSLDFTPANVFTPNKDGKNDTFYIPNLPEDDCNDQFQGIEIYNRFGVLVFKSTDRSFEWDGKNATSGQYYFLIKYRNKTYKNWLTILRD